MISTIIHVRIPVLTTNIFLMSDKQLNTEGLIGIIGYLTLLGWLIAFFVLIRRYEKTDADMFHMRQSLGLQLSGLVLAFVAIFIGTLTTALDWVFHVLAFVVFVFFSTASACIPLNFTFSFR